MARLESTFGVENGLVEQSPEAHLPEVLYIVRTVVRDHREVPVRVLIPTFRDQKLTKESHLAHLRTSPTGDPIRCGTTTGPRYYLGVSGRDCSSGAKPECR
jgi:hypothetical protein